VIHYTDDLASVREEMLHGFFVGWPRRPSPAQHLAVLRGSYRSVVAIDDAHGRVVGFMNMLSDGVLAAFIPWLEVLPGYQGEGIGDELMRRALDGADRFYSIDLVCDAELVPYYARFGMRAARRPIAPSRRVAGQSSRRSLTEAESPAQRGGRDAQKSV
jgi:GNAT superfamily N-acetyltransferase